MNTSVLRRFLVRQGKSIKATPTGRALVQALPATATSPAVPTAPAGSAITYPTTVLHRVEPVRRGVRLVRVALWAGERRVEVMLGGAEMASGAADEVE